MKRLAAAFVLVLPVIAFAGSEFDFDWDDKNDMRGAWMMCATTGFTGDGCSKVYQKCWQPPMIYRKKHKTKTFCEDPPDFSVSESDKNRYLDEANRRSREDNSE